MPSPRTTTARLPRDQLAALRLALRLTAGLFSTMAFRSEHQPFGLDAYDALDWLRAQLAPLARRERVIRDLLSVLDPVTSQRAPWSRPPAAKRELLRLASLAQGSGRINKKAQRG